jgi:polyketide synthase PksJ
MAESTTQRAALPSGHARTEPPPAPGDGECQEDNHTVMDLLRRSVERWPDSVAMFTESGAVTFSNLADRVRRRADGLRLSGVCAGEVVAIELGLSTAYVESLLAVWAIGATALPLDPRHPLDRRAYQVRAAGCTHVLTGGESDGALDEIARQLRAAEGAHGVSGDATAYILFTSGSTGRPKGVAVAHSSLLRMLVYFANVFAEHASGPVLAHTATVFDVSLLELLLPLIAGGSISLPPPASVRNPEILASWLATNPVTTVFGTPTWWRLVLPFAAPALRGAVAVCLGEALTADLATVLRSLPAAVWNIYGPTEATVGALAWKVEGKLADPLPIGTPIDGINARLVDDRGEPVRPNQPGELVLTGPGLAKGYVNVGPSEPNGFRFDDNGRATEYRTGDLCRSRPGGLFEYVGRKDNQVKVRGHRVELEEIEATAELCDGVRRAVAVISTATSGGTILNLVLCLDRQNVGAGRIRADLSRDLPNYMIPDRIFWTQRMPETTSGKVDRSAVRDLVRLSRFDRLPTEGI